MKTEQNLPITKMLEESNYFWEKSSFYDEILPQVRTFEIQQLSQAKANAEAMVVEVLEDMLHWYYPSKFYDAAWIIRMVIERFQKKSQEGNTICDNLTTNE